ncbi:transcription factor Opi1-domain-containing protein [Calycina marina]|uniref:Transcription factor Opi1-domain-containing protein n=1 Tax=Calycina marina TaxID=1763456 RepID=A0A9P7YZS4_9HELO|nr:transcription factor Opi1-domain-containing protein [Calycina marina]
MEDEKTRDHMQSEQPPSYAQSHNPQSPNFPNVPDTALPPIYHERTLPPLPAVPAEQRYRSETATEAPYVWPSSNPLTAYYQPGPSQLSPKNKTPPHLQSPAPMALDVPDAIRQSGGVFIDDPDVRMAAEALGDLRSDFIHSPPHNQQTSIPPRSPRTFQLGSPRPEPLLSLLTTSHPLIGNAIGGSISAYSKSKDYSPRFKSSAEYVERISSPVVNTVGTVGRITGVEGGVRWFLGGRRPSHHQPSDMEFESGSNKRRKVGNGMGEGEMDRSVPNDPYSVRREFQQRRPSQVSATDSLPAYDDYRSPSYEISQQQLIPTRSDRDEPTSPGGSSWPSRLVLSTSGLSIAMSEESLRSLKYCLSWLRWANEHIGKLIEALKTAMDEYDNPSAITDGTWEAEKNDEAGGQRGDGQMMVRSNALNYKVAALKAEVLKTLKQVVDVVSKYTGGALPENASILVRKHLTSLPQRFRLASKNAPRSSGEEDAKDGANRVIVLAKEGLDMMVQVSGVLDGTIVSAEEWCERLGRKKREEAEGSGSEVEMAISPSVARQTLGQHLPFLDVKSG